MNEQDRQAYENFVDSTGFGGCGTWEAFAEALEYVRGKQDPVFWYRPRSDGGYEGPIHNGVIEDVRKTSGAWVPLVPLVPAKPAATEPVTPYSLDLDPLGIRRLVCDAVTGAMGFGAQNSNRPPTGHWLEEFWDMARHEKEMKTEAVRGLVEAALAAELHLFYTIRTPECRPDATDLLSLLQKALAEYREATKS